MIKKQTFSPSFSLAQRKEAKETSTLTKPSPIWEGLTAPPRRSFRPIKGAACVSFRLTPGRWRYSISRTTAPPYPRATEILWYSHSTLLTPHSTDHFSFVLPPFTGRIPRTRCRCLGSAHRYTDSSACADYSRP